MDAFTQNQTPGGELISPLCASRIYALERLEAFMPRVGRAYAETRNSDYGPRKRSNVSVLSPWIRHRLILEEDVIEAVLRRHSFSTAQKFLQEIFWRTYFKGWLEHRPQVWQRYRGDVRDLAEELASNAALRQRYDTAIEGRTGIDCMDAWTNELIETGYLHNHARMWFASIWIFTLQLPWQLGADFFLRHLFDGDPASNTLSWRWVAGLHTKGKTYLARASNIENFTHGRFNPVGQLSETALPLEEVDAGPPTPPPPIERLDTGEPFLLLVTKEDCAPECLDLPYAPSTILGLTAPDSHFLMPLSSEVRHFSAKAVDDALSRSAAYFGVEAGDLETAEWADALKARTQEVGVNTIVTAYAPVGPTADRLEQAAASLKQDGIQILQIRRAYDSAAWAHATKGFFGLKKKIPDILSALNLNF